MECKQSTTDGANESSKRRLPGQYCSAFERTADKEARGLAVIAEEEVEESDKGEEKEE